LQIQPPLHIAVSWLRFISLKKASLVLSDKNALSGIYKVCPLEYIVLQIPKRPITPSIFIITLRSKSIGSRARRLPPPAL